MPAATILLLALPWLNPFSPGPTPSVPTWLFGWGCAAALLLIQALSSMQRPARTAASGAWGIHVPKAWLLAALLSVAIALLQYFGVSEHFSPWVNTTRAGEAFANLRQRNQFATLANIGLAALLWGVANARLPRLHLAAALVAAALLGAGNAASSSRTGALQLLLLVGAALSWQRQQWSSGAVVLRLAAVAVASYAIATVALPLLVGLDPQATGLLGRVHENVDACSSRKILWANVLHLIAQRPWLGWGWGELDYAHFVTLYPGERFCDLLDNAHNLPLHFAVELGVPFALVFCGLCVALVVRAKPWAESVPHRQMAWAVIAVIALHSLLEYPLWYGPFQIAMLISIGMLWRSERKLPLAPVLQAGAAIVLIAIAGYVAWDYWRMSQLYLASEQRASAYRDDTLAKLQDTRLFQDQVRFAELSTTEVTAENAEAMLVLSKKMLHFSPEPRVVEKLLQSAAILGRADEVQFYAARYEAAFPADYARWMASSGGQKAP